MLELSRRINAQQFNTIINHREEKCASIFISNEQEQGEAEHRRIYVKNSMREYKAALEATTLSREKRRQAMKQIGKLSHVTRQWRTGEASIALFIAPSFSMGFELLHPIQSRMVIDSQFHMKPLFAIAEEPYTFHILTLGKGHTKLYQVTRGTLAEVDLPALPKSIDEVLEEYDFERTLQFRTDTPRAVGGRAAHFHGHGAAGDSSKLKGKVVEFIGRVNDEVCRYLRDKRGPLVIAAARQIGHLFLEKCDYSNLLTNTIEGNPAAFNPPELLERATQLVSAHLYEMKYSRFDELQNLKHSNLCSISTEKVVSASAQGAIDSLFVRVDSYIWGSFDPKSHQVDFHTRRTQSSCDLLTTAAANTFKHDGKVYPVFDHERLLPDETEIAALFRYPFTSAQAL